MAPSRKEFNALVHRIEEYAGRAPREYALRLFLLGLLGYGYLLAVLILLCGVIALVVYGTVAGRTGALAKLLIPLAVFGYMLLRALWVRIAAPQGVPLVREDAPHLFALLDELTFRLKAPRYHRVLLDGDFNAGVAQVPRLGVFGFQRNYIVLGLPLLAAFSPEQFKAILAHELGHLSAEHSKFGTWIYRVSATYHQIMDALERERHWGTFLIRPFFNWYTPYFDAYSFVYMRRNELNADAYAADIAGAGSVAGALVNTVVVGQYVERSFWPLVYRRAAELPEPPHGVYREALAALREWVTPEVGRRWLEEELLLPTGTGDTHPALCERLLAIGYDYRGEKGDEFVRRFAYAPPERSAAQHFFEGRLDEIVDAVEAEWRRTLEGAWCERHRQAQVDTARREELDAKESRASLAVDELWERARIVADLQGYDEAEPFLRSVLEAKPAHPGANFALGSLLLERGDAEGIRLIEKSMERDPECVMNGCNLVYDFLRRRGRAREAEEFADRADLLVEQVERGAKERFEVRQSDTFLHHGLPDGEVESLRVQMAEYADVEEAHVVRKAVAYFPDRPFYVFAVKPGYRWYNLKEESGEEKLALKLSQELRFPDDFMVIVLSSQTKGIVKRLKEMGVRPFYCRPGS